MFRLVNTENTRNECTAPYYFTIRKTRTAENVIRSDKDIKNDINLSEKRIVISFIA